MITMKKLPIYIFSLTLPLVILLASFNSAAFDISLIEKQLEKVGVYQNIEKDQVRNQSENLINYFKNKEELNKEFYTERELLHLADTKNLLMAVKIVYGILSVILIVTAIYIYKKNSLKLLAKTALKSLVVALLFYLVLLGVSQIFFDQLFLLFHKISFTNDFWLLDPATENLVVIFPPAFFLSMTEFVIVKSLAVTVLTLLLAYSFLKLMGKSKKI